MNSKTPQIVLVCLCLLGAVAAFYLLASRAGSGATGNSGGFFGPKVIHRVPVIVAAFDIRKGDKIQSVHLRTKLIDASRYKGQMMTSGEENAYLGHFAARNIKVGAIISKIHDLEPPSTAYALAARDIAAGDPIQAEDIAVLWPGEKSLSNDMVPLEEFPLGSLAGVPIRKGMPITSRILHAPKAGAPHGLSLKALPIPPRSQGRHMPIVLAARDILSGERLDAGGAAQIGWIPKASFSPDMIASGEETALLPGAFALVDIKAGDPVLKSGLGHEKPVVVATRDIAAGEAIASDMIEAHWVFESKLPADAISPSDFALDSEAAADIKAGDPVTASALAPKKKKK